MKHAITGLFFLAWFLIAMHEKAEAADPLDFTRCAAIASDYSQNPFAVSMGDLDALRLCVTEQMAATVADRQNEKESRAIGRNFARDEE